MEMEQKNKTIKINVENKILIMLAFFSIAIGLWGNFRQLWLQANGLEVTMISKLLSISTLICAIGIFIISKKVTLDKLKNFISFSLVIKSCVLIGLFKLNKSEYVDLIKLLVIFDVLIEKLIIISIYPFITTIKKSDKLYSKRKLIEYFFKDVGILIGGMLIGRNLFNLIVDYNICLWISIIFTVCAFLVTLDIKSTENNKENTKKRSLSYILKDDILILYLLVYFVSNIAMSTGLGLKMLMLTNLCNFKDSTATNYLLIIGLIADAIGVLALKYFTPKNDYITISIKFLIRFLLYVLAFYANSIDIVLLAMTWSIMISTAYENVTDAPYINRVVCEHQLTFTNYRYILGVIGESIGLFFAGKMYEYGANYMLGLSAFFMIFQLIISYILVFLRHREKFFKLSNIVEVKESANSL